MEEIKIGQIYEKSCGCMIRIIALADIIGFVYIYTCSSHSNKHKQECWSIYDFFKKAVKEKKYKLLKGKHINTIFGDI